MVKEFLSNYFGFNRQQRNGLLVLMSLSALLLIVRVTYPSFMKPPTIQIKNLPVFSTDSLTQITETKASVLFYFDPNTVSKEELIRLGLKEKTAGTVIKFRSKKPFRSADDFGKVYGISPSLFQKLRPFIKMEQGKVNKINNQTFPAERVASSQLKTVELNAADSSQLTELQGIGPTFAHRIIKYRSILGGYVAKEQLREVYGMKEETYNLVQKNVTVDAASIKKINLNSDDFKTVNRHPYISYELTKELFNKKRQAPLTLTVVKEIVGNDSLYQRLLPYLSF